MQLFFPNSSAQFIVHELELEDVGMKWRDFGSCTTSWNSVIKICLKSILR